MCIGAALATFNCKSIPGMLAYHVPAPLLTHPPVVYVSRRAPALPWFSSTIADLPAISDSPGYGFTAPSPASSPTSLTHLAVVFQHNRLARAWS